MRRLPCGRRRFTNSRFFQRRKPTNTTTTLAILFSRLRDVPGVVVRGAIFGESGEGFTPGEALHYIAGTGFFKEPVTVEAAGNGGRAVTANGNVVYFEVALPSGESNKTCNLCDAEYAQGTGGERMLRIGFETERRLVHLCPECKAEVEHEIALDN